MPTKYEKHGRKYYEKNKALCLERNRQTRARWRQEWREFKATLQCEQCGEDHPSTIDFHHPIENDPDKKPVNALARAGQYKRAYEEARRCVVLCANCHRKHHWEEHQKKRGAEAPLLSNKTTD